LKDWPTAIRDGMVSGSVASLTSAAVLAIGSRIETGHAPATVNATSHWVWGDEAALHNGVSSDYTGLGMLIHHGASVFWAVIYERLAGEAAERGSPGLPGVPGVPGLTGSPYPALAAGLVGAGVASFVDYLCVPKRLTPGFEFRLSRPAIAAGYLAFGAGLAATSLLRGAAHRRKMGRPRPAKPPMSGTSGTRGSGRA
jgi:hypothetical protein